MYPSVYVSDVAEFLAILVKAGSNRARAHTPPSRHIMVSEWIYIQWSTLRASTTTCHDPYHATETVEGRPTLATKQRQHGEYSTAKTSVAVAEPFA